MPIDRNILLLPGDGVGPEVVSEVSKIISALEEIGITFECEHALIGGVAIDQCNDPLPESTLNLAKDSDAIFLGAVGGERYNSLPFEKRPEQGLLRIRKGLNLFANLRPSICYPELTGTSPLKPELVEGLDILIVRELMSGIYFGEPRGIEEMPDGQRQGINTLRYSESEIERVAEVAFTAASRRSGRLCSIDKANVLESSLLWREVLNSVSKKYPDVHLSHMYVDNAAMQLMRKPKQFDVIVTDNMFGDILSDEAAMLVGSIGLLPSASLGESGKGLYEPVHGSAPDISGKGMVNPLAALLSFAMLLRYSLDDNETAKILEIAVQEVLAEGLRTFDIATDGDQIVGTSEMGDAVALKIRRH